MPELPEVETTRRGLELSICHKKISQILLWHHQLRWPIPSNLPELLQHQELKACHRRGKYLIWEFDAGYLLIHLGMSGSLRTCANDIPKLKHDHIQWSFGTVAVRLHDPRRFGAVLWHPQNAGPIESHPLLAHLGIEPFDPLFDAQYLHQHLKKHTSSLKTALLNGKIVVGIGNIYCSESLFRAKIHPSTPANRISLKRCESLVIAIRETLQEALAAGGSTLRNYTNLQGEVGSYFDIYARVYEKEGQPCQECGTMIKRIIQGQRATYYCPKCQRY